MSDEEFEKYFEQMENIYFVLGDYYFEYYSVEERKAKLKEILEEIENNAKGEVLHQVFDKEAKP